MSGRRGHGQEEFVLCSDGLTGELVYAESVMRGVRSSACVMSDATPSGGLTSFAPGGVTALIVSA